MNTSTLMSSMKTGASEVRMLAHLFLDTEHHAGRGGTGDIFSLYFPSI
jgi:hypothetical protein